MWTTPTTPRSGLCTSRRQACSWALTPLFPPRPFHLLPEEAYPSRRAPLGGREFLHGSEMESAQREPTPTSSGQCSGSKPGPSPPVMRDCSCFHGRANIAEPRGTCAWHFHPFAETHEARMAACSAPFFSPDQPEMLTRAVLSGSLAICQRAALLRSTNRREHTGATLASFNSWPAQTPCRLCLRPPVCDCHLHGASFTVP